MKNINKIKIVSTILCFFPMLIGLTLYSRLPSELPTNWGFSGEINGYSNKLIVIFVLPILMGALNWFSISRMHKIEMPKTLRIFFAFIIPIAAVMGTGASYLWGLGYFISTTRLASVLLGVVFVALGMYMPNIKLNSFIGIRLKKTLSSNIVWEKTHRFAGNVWRIGGLLILLLGSMLNGYILFLILIFMVILPIIYAYFVNE